MRNPFKRFYKYFTAKSVKQRIYVIIAFFLLAVFAFFFIKGNFFDNRNAPQTSQSESADSGDSDDTSQAEEAEQSAPEQSAPHFTISFFDCIALIGLIGVFVFARIRRKLKMRR